MWNLPKPPRYPSELQRSREVTQLCFPGLTQAVYVSWTQSGQREAQTRNDPIWSGGLLRRSIGSWSIRVTPARMMLQSSVCVRQSVSSALRFPV
jgi:hypothetical protein